MATFCLTKEATQRFKQALKNGEIDPLKLATMTSEQRRSALSQFVGEENTKQVNALFESKLLLKNQRAGYVSWAKKITGIAPKTRQDILAKIERLETALNPTEEQAFLEDLVQSRLNLEVTQQEAKTISDSAKRIAELEKKANKDGVFPSETDRLAYGAEKVALEEYVNDLKLKEREISISDRPAEKAVSVVKETPGVLKSILSTLDNSFFGRQGIKTLYLSPRTWAKAFVRSWGDIGKELGGRDAMRAIKADIYSRPNAINGKYKAGGYGLDVLTEEAYPSALPEKIPLFGRIFKASSSAYNGAALRMRADLADAIIKKAEQNGVNTLRSDEARPIGNLIGSLTGRGSLGKGEVFAKDFNVLMFSIKFLKSNIDTLLAPVSYGGKKAATVGGYRFKNKGAEFASKEAAIRSLRIFATIAAILATAKTIDPDSVDEDPRSTNFGKIKVFGRWVDITGGLASLATLLARVTPTTHDGELGLWTKSSTGKWTNRWSGQYGVDDPLDLVVQTLFTNKLSPFARAVYEVWKQETFEGGKPTLEGYAKKALIPLPIQQGQEILKDKNAAMPLLSIVLEGLGFSTSSPYVKPPKDWSQSESKQMVAFKNKVGEKKLKQANEEFNEGYEYWLKNIENNKTYKNLTDDEKQSVQTRKANALQTKIMKEYGFTYKPPKVNKKKEREIKKLIK